MKGSKQAVRKAGTGRTQAERGSVPHLKLITELLEQHAGKRREKGAALLLLEKLERMERNGETAGADEPLEEPWPE